MCLLGLGDQLVNEPQRMKAARRWRQRPVTGGVHRSSVGLDRSAPCVTSWSDRQNPRSTSAYPRSPHPAPYPYGKRRLSVTRGKKRLVSMLARHTHNLPHRILKRGMRNWARALFGHLLLTTPLIYGDRSRLFVSASATINNTLFNLKSGRIDVHDDVMLAHNVCLLTGTHATDAFGSERIGSHPIQGRDIVIEEGAWIASNTTVLGGCRVGRHAVVAAGSVVTHDVPAYTIVAGIPARTIRRLR